MNETPLPTRKTGRTEMDDLVSRLFPDMDEPTTTGFMSSSGLHLTLVHPDEEADAIQADAVEADDERVVDSIASARLADESPCIRTEPELEFASLHGLCDGHSSGVDISIQPGISEQSQREASRTDAEEITNATSNEAETVSLQFADTWQLPSSDGSAIAGSGPAPKRIGDGKLVQARLTWKPGDPFGEPTRSKKKTFKWELMLTTACVTAACGMVCIWLLRTVLA